MSRLLALNALLGLAAFASSARVRYDNYRVFAVLPRTPDQLAVVKALDGTRDSFVFLDAVHYVNKKISVVVAPISVLKFLTILRSAGVEYELLNSNAQSQLDIHEQVADVNRTDDVYSFDKYHELDDTYGWLHSLAVYRPEQVTLFVAGESHEGRQILGVKISTGYGNKKAIFLESGIHAGEWIGPATTTYIINELLTNNSTDVRTLASNFDWYIVPHANPDGYVYTHTTNRLWRKTRSSHEHGCFGVDLNRNWGFHWNEVGASNQSCSNTYAGPAPFSEIETRTLAAFISTLKGKILLYVSFHACSQQLLFPYGYTPDLPENYDSLKQIMDVSVTAIKQRYGTKYTGGPVYKSFYPAAGSSLDWVYGVLKVPYAFAYELRPAGTSFWLSCRLPAAQILPTSEEMFDSLVAMVKETIYIHCLSKCRECYSNKT